MKVEYFVTFNGVIPKHQAVLEKMLRDDIAAYPARMKMDGATVERAGRPKPSQRFHNTIYGKRARKG